MTTDQLHADGALDFLGDALPEILASVLTELGIDPAVSFSQGSITIYVILPIDVGQLNGVLDVGLGGTIGIWVSDELASLTDFAFFPATESDPAMAIAVNDNNGTVSAGVGQNWTRHFMTLYAPTDSAAWKRAAYAAVGLVYKAMPTATVQHIDDAQWEIAPVANTVPAAFSPARSLDVWVRPTRLNHVTNPSFEVDLTDWTTVGATITRIATDAAQGIACMAVTSFGTGETVTHIVKTLTPGHTYTASVYIRSIDGKDVAMQVNGARNGTGFEASKLTWMSAPLGDGANPSWRRLWVSFVADTTIANLQITSLGATSIRVDGALIEEGNGLKQYFDGDSGLPDYVWETGGAVGKSRSYYYQDKLNRHYALGKTLRENVQLGLVVGDPVYASSTSATTTPYGSGPYGSGPYGG
jgi:hypothetical protein